MWRSLKLASLLLLLARAPSSLLAQEVPSADLPALIEAEEINYDENLGVITAKGNVEISQNERVLQADTVSYNMRSDVVTASGNVRLVEPSGEVIFAEFAEITGDLREGFIHEIRIMLTDRSRLAGANGQRTVGNFTEVNKGVFSPCELCKEDPTRPPLWQLKAQRVIHDQEDQTIRYHGAWLEMFGVPVIYTPYFEHPDPTARRKSGFLSPSYSSSESLGFTLQVPYFWNISPDRDLTLEPIFTTEQNAVFVSEYREAFTFGELSIAGSGTIADREEKEGDVDENVFRGHVKAAGRFEVDETWRVGFDANRATDDTYLRVYNFSGAGDLTSRIFAEGFRGRNYLSINNFAYQGLQEEDDDGERPFISPLIDYNFVSQPLFWDSTVELDSNLLVLTRTDGRDSNRLSLNGGWRLPFTGPLGDRFDLNLSLTADGYWVNSFDPDDPEDVNPQGEPKDSLTGRVFPRMALGWRYPFVQFNEGFSQAVEPIAQVVLAPEGSNPDLIPNEDSGDFEFDDTNLFSLNRFTGSDRVDPGPRVDYGLKWNIVGDSGAYATAFLGQSYRLAEIDDDELFPQGSGVEDNFSDIVGRVELRPSEYLDLTYRFRVDRENLNPRRTEVGGELGPDALNLDITYTFVEDFSGSEEFSEEREELRVKLTSKIGRYWSVFGAHRRDLEQNQDLVWQAGITYEDECFTIRGAFERSFFSDRDVTQEDAFFVNVSFKHLGGIGGGG